MESAHQGSRGFDDLTERKALEILLRAQAASRPSTALREGRLAEAHPVEEAQLPQVWLLKRALSKERFGAKSLGQLREELSKKVLKPSDRHEGYFCFHKVRKIGEKPSCIAVATTVALQERWIEFSHGPAAIDGGFKFNLMG